MDIKKMRFGVLTEKMHAEVRERKLPEIGPDEVLVKQEACNICTTDYQQWMGLREGRGYPMASGHESSGVVVETGENVKDLMPGDKVALAYVTCGICDGCKRGLGCDNNEIGPKKMSKDGYRGMFAYADYAVRPARALVKMNPELDASEAAFVEPLAAVVKGLKKLRVMSLENVVVVGAGTMGLLNAQAARALGCRVIVSELMDHKLKAAREMGFEVIDGKQEDPAETVKQLTGGKGADAVVLAVAATAVNEQSFELVKQLDGRVLFFGAAYPAPELNIDSNLIHYRRLELVGTFGADLQDFCVAADMLNQRKVRVNNLLERKRYSLDEIQEAFAEASIPGKFRVSVRL